MKQQRKHYTAQGEAIQVGTCWWPAAYLQGTASRWEDMSGPKSGTAACRRVAIARQMPIGADRATDSADVAVHSWFRPEAPIGIKGAGL